jgi:hypothetical protein
MKKYYIVFTNYSSGGFGIHGIFTRKTEGVQLFKRKVKDFLTYGPDDSTYLRLIKVELEPEEVEVLKVDDDSDELIELLEDKIWTRDCDELLVEGCDSIWTEIIPSYCRDHDLNPDDETEFDEGREILFNDDDMFSDYVDYYIDENY